ALGELPAAHEDLARAVDGARPHVAPPVRIGLRPAAVARRDGDRQRRRLGRQRDTFLVEQLELHEETGRARVEAIVCTRTVEQEPLPQHAPVEAGGPQRAEVAGGADVGTGAVAAAHARAGTVVAAVAILAGLARVVAAHRGSAADDRRGDLVGPLARQPGRQDVPGPRGREVELAVGILAAAG